MTQSIVIANTSIGQDEHGRYCLNHLHKAAGGNRRHNPTDWLRSNAAKELVAELAKECALENGGYAETRRPSSEMRKPVVIVNDGKNNGTYAVKELVYAYAMWISPKFHLNVIRAFDQMAAPQSGQPAAVERGAWLSFDEINIIADAAKPGELGREARQTALKIFARVAPASQELALSEQASDLLGRHVVELTGQVTQLVNQVMRLSRKVITTQGQLIRTQKHVTTLVEGRMDGAQASATIVQMHRDGHSNAQIVAATGRNTNHVRQTLWQARRDGVLPPLADSASTASAQANLFKGA